MSHEGGVVNSYRRQQYGWVDNHGGGEYGDFVMVGGCKLLFSSYTTIVRSVPL
jgi:hypothetical protein